MPPESSGPESVGRDEVESALNALAAAAPAPTADAVTVMTRGRRRVVQRRVALVGVIVVLVAGVATVGARAGAHKPARVVSSVPTPTAGTHRQPADAGGPASQIIAVSATEAWKCLEPLEYTDNGGSTWTTIALPAGITSDNIICAAVPGGHAWVSWVDATTNASRLIRVDSRGHTQMGSLPSRELSGNALAGPPEFIDADHGWIEVTNGDHPTDLYRTSNGGSTWTLIGHDEVLGDLAFANSQQGWSAGRALLTTLDGGATWTPVSLPTPQLAKTTIGLFRVVVRGDAVVVWAGVHISGARYRTFFDVSSDRGHTWSLLEGPAGFEVPNAGNNAFDAADASHIMVASGRVLRVSDDGGRTWLKRPDLPATAAQSISYANANVAWLTTTDGLVLRSSNAGRSWVDVTAGGHATTTPTQPAGPNPQPPAPLALVSATEGWVCGDPFVYSTADFNQSTGGTKNVNIPAPGSSAASGAASQPSLCAAAPGGNAWLLRASNDPDRPEIVRIRGAGANVHVFSFPAIPDSVVQSFDFADADTGWALVDHRSGHTQPDLYVTHDGGATWSVLLRGSAPLWGQLDFENAKTGWASGYALPNLATTTDGGNTWRTVSIPTPKGATQFAPVVPVLVNGSVVVAYGAWSTDTGVRPRPFIEVSLDGGKVWNLQAGPAGVTVAGGTDTHVFSAADADHWALAAGNRLYTTDNGGLTWTNRQEFAGVGEIQYVARPSATAMFVSGPSDLANHSTVVLGTVDAGASWTPIGG